MRMFLFHVLEEELEEDLCIDCEVRHEGAHPLLPLSRRGLWTQLS